MYIYICVLCISVCLCMFIFCIFCPRPTHTYSIQTRLSLFLTDRKAKLQIYVFTIPQMNSQQLSTTTTQGIVTEVNLSERRI